MLWDEPHVRVVLMPLLTLTGRDRVPEVTQRAMSDLEEGLNMDIG